MDHNRMAYFLDIIEWLDKAPNDYKVTVEYKELRRELVSKHAALLHVHSAWEEFYNTRDSLNDSDSQLFSSAWDSAKYLI